MNKEIAMKWVAALRSGEYKQGKQCLNNNNEKFCCLGVLCELAIKDGIQLNKENSTFNGIFEYDSYIGTIQKKVKDWSGIDSCIGEAKDKSFVLTDLNDNENKTFEEIADIIEANYEKL